MHISYVFAGLVVTNRDHAAAWYERLLGRPPDMLPNDAEAAWQITPQASLYLVAEAERAGNGVVTLIVDDLEGALAEIAARGIVVGEIHQVGSAGRKSVMLDPDGNQVALVQLGPSSKEAT